MNFKQCCITTIIFIMFFCVSAVKAESVLIDKYVVIEILADIQNIRESNDPDSKIIGKLTIGDNVRVIEINGDWAKITYESEFVDWPDYSNHDGSSFLGSVTGWVSVSGFNPCSIGFDYIRQYLNDKDLKYPKCILPDDEERKKISEFVSNLSIKRYEEFTLEQYNYIKNHTLGFIIYDRGGGCGSSERILLKVDSYKNFSMEHNGYNLYGFGNVFDSDCDREEMCKVVNPLSGDMAQGEVSMERGKCYKSIDCGVIYSPDSFMIYSDFFMLSTKTWYMKVDGIWRIIKVYHLNSC